ncbi:hypothetical protein CEXT_90421 [Caerostris extrusa]|uniref:Uncharacterized protein n=1 Tax=Caerostris extrusa TaxID=172846 RepID=A0AAV4MIC5_CAEEX|nr:hypothetical protein CEXT_90421 [Caerostris extrusa]
MTKQIKATQRVSILSHFFTIAGKKSMTYNGYRNAVKKKKKNGSQPETTTGFLRRGLLVYMYILVLCEESDLRKKYSVCIFMFFHATMNAADETSPAFVSPCINTF